jgi:hypothetical protein
MRHRRQRGGAAANALIGLATLLGLATVVLISSGWYVARNVRVTEPASGETRVETPFGSVRVRERARLDPPAMGVPVYPGAERLEDSRKLASFELRLGGEQKEMTVAVAEYVTPDPIGKVEEFYRGSMAGARVRGGHDSRLVLEVSGPGVKKVVALHARGSGTRISLASFAEAAAN